MQDTAASVETVQTLIEPLQRLRECTGTETIFERCTKLSHRTQNELWKMLQSIISNDAEQLIPVFERAEQAGKPLVFKGEMPVCN